MFKIGTDLWGVGWGGRVILVRHNLSIIPHFENNTLVSRVTPENIMLYFTSITQQTLACSAKGVPSFLSYSKTLGIGPPLEIKPMTSHSVMWLYYGKKWKIALKIGFSCCPAVLTQ